MPELSQFTVGLMHIQLLHTSASLAINENWDPDVRDDMEMMLNRIIPEDVPFRHSCEGPDDMVRRAATCANFGIGTDHFLSGLTRIVLLSRLRRLLLLVPLVLLMVVGISSFLVLTKFLT